MCGIECGGPRGHSIASDARAASPVTLAGHSIYSLAPREPRSDRNATARDILKLARNDRNPAIEESLELPTQPCYLIGPCCRKVDIFPLVHVARVITVVRVQLLLAVGRLPPGRQLLPVPRQPKR
eukprot:5078195-Prymnesium_polylepis.1